MSARDDEANRLRNEVTCTTILERMTTGWKFDRTGSTRRALKFRRGKGEILIVTHDGRGWWDPLSSAKGDIFDLAQHIDPSLNFGQVRQALLRLVGLPRIAPTPMPDTQTVEAIRTPEQRWNRRPKLRAGAPGWAYLHETRALPPVVLTAASAQDIVREGHRGSTWFAHRDGDRVSHVEVRGPACKTSLRNGHKTLFRFAGGGKGITRLIVAEAPIDALSLAALEATRADTIYAATGGGMGPATIAAIEALIEPMRATSGAVLASATDGNEAGDAFATRHAGMAAAAGIGFERLRPPDGADWNDVLRKRRS
jgi:hypothetical protein